MDVESDADSDELEIQSENARFEKSVQAFLANHVPQGEDWHQPSPNAKVGTSSFRRLHRRRRKDAELRGDIKFRLAQVNRAFLSGNLDGAEGMIHEIIRINAETHQAWATLATICEEQGREKDALTAKLYASHLHPKDAAAWLGCADLALSIAGDDDESPALKTAGTCFASAISAQPNNLRARIGRADVNYRRGHLVKAIREYLGVLQQSPHDIFTVRKLAQACEASMSWEHIQKALDAYSTAFSHLISSPGESEAGLLWGDVSIVVELLASAGKFLDAVKHLRSLARWLLGRRDEAFWDEWEDDDREWDAENTRRVGVDAFDSSRYNANLHGLGLPMEFRARLGLYRLKMHQDEEANRHLSWLEPTELATELAVKDFPDLIQGIADALFESERTSLALEYYELLRATVYGRHPSVLLALGRCYLKLEDIQSAEDYFLLTIREDESNIDARVELAKIYEDASEDEEALILVTEAIALQTLGNSTTQTRSRGARGRPTTEEDMVADRNSQTAARKVFRHRYRPKRLTAPDERRQEERIRADELSRKYQEVRDLKEMIQNGNRALIPSWMAAAKDLVDDFVSFRQFYTWDRYVKYLGAVDNIMFSANFHVQISQGTPELRSMAERLSKNITPGQTCDRRVIAPADDHGHRGIPFGDWLELFLDYAISLALAGRGEESYQVCEAARDSIVFTNSKDYMFMIHVSWAACAVYMGDEEMCVATGRFFTKVHYLDSDAYRMFAALCRLCQSPASWYNSGPVQKYILRQIRQIDHTQLGSIHRTRPADPASGERGVRNLDVCLLVLYGHILFTSTSYTFALNYFLRARSLDPANAMVNLSVGLGYVHHGLKRQSENRQYSIMQGLSCIFQYLDTRSACYEGADKEARFNVARVYHMLGLHHLAQQWYVGITNNGKGSGDISLSAAYSQLVLSTESSSIAGLGYDVLSILEM